jgi:hypothetical protein
MRAWPETRRSSYASRHLALGRTSHHRVSPESRRSPHPADPAQPAFPHDRRPQETTPTADRRPPPRPADAPIDESRTEPLAQSSRPTVRVIEVSVTTNRVDHYPTGDCWDTALCVEISTSFDQEVESVADRVAGQSRDPLQQIMQEAAGRAAAQKIIDAKNRWAKQKLPADGELLINEYRRVARVLASDLRRERAGSKRHQSEARSRATGGFLLGAVMGFVLAVILTKLFWS